MKKLIKFIVFSAVSCVVATASALWEHGRRFVRDIFFAGQAKSGIMIYDAIINIS